MPTWRFYDGAAERMAGGYQADWAPSMASFWMLPSYQFQANIPSADLTEIVDAISGDPIWPDAVNPYFHIPKYPETWPNVLERGLPIPQNWALPSKNEVNDDGNHGLLGESQPFYDTWNRKLLWHSPHAYWTPYALLPPVQHLIIYSDTGGQPPIALLSLDSPIGPGTKYEFDWSGGLFGTEEDRYGIVFEVVEA